MLPPSICTVTAYFSNGLVVEKRVGLARALRLMEHKAAIIPYDADLMEVRGVSGSVLIPTSIAFPVQKALIPPDAPVLTRQGLWERDGRECVYCGKPVHLAEATIDHIIPRSQGGENSWENTVIACRKCNNKKANRTPREAGMALRRKPFTFKVRLRHA